MNEATAGPPQRTPSRRVEFIDLIRGWALIVMIETHVSNATLSREVMAGDLFQVVKFINGLVAPAFLFASGFAYALTTHRKLNDYLSFNSLLYKQVGRLLFILGIGYLLHLPKFNFTQLVYQTNERDWQVFYQADVLQCIAVSLLSMQALLLILRSERRLYITMIVLSILIVLATPIMWGIDFWQYLPAALAAYFNGLHFSLFPLFPWSAFLFAGSIMGYVYLQAKGGGMREVQTGKDVTMMKRAVFFALGIIAVSFPLHLIVASAYPTYDYWQYSPSFVILRLGLVLLFLVFMFWFERRKGVSPGSAVTLLGRESLVVYATHLLLIYGNFGVFNFRNWVNHTYGYLEALAATAVLLLFMYVLARLWGQIKRGEPRKKLAVELATLAGFLGVFFFGPGQ